MRINKQCILFGCGEMGRVAYSKLCNSFDIYAYTDNNADLWGTNVNNIKIISPEEALKYVKENECYIIITLRLYREVFMQIKDVGTDKILVWHIGLLYKFSEEGYIYNRSVEKLDIYKKKNATDMSILFLQPMVCIRTLKIAKAMSEKGIKASLAYLVDSPRDPEYSRVFENIYPIYSMEDFILFLNESEFDLIHSSNEPDFLTVLAQKCNKTVVHDCHDLGSAYKSMTPDEMVAEFIANKRSDGVIYTTEGIRRESVKRFKLEYEYTHALENLISKELKSDRKYEKLSSIDGVLHCVYEGGVVDDPDSHRFFEIIWNRLTKAGVHIHFYTNGDADYCKYLESLDDKIHYEGNITSMQLAAEMTKYDVGLCVLNVTSKNKQYLEYDSPNKIQEYINAGIPVAVGDVESQIEYVENNLFGKHLDLEKNVLTQLKDISNIKIENNILSKKGFTFESQIGGLLKFYEKCIERHKNTHE